MASDRGKINVDVDESGYNTEVAEQQDSPAVIQCIKCRSILGDTTSWVSGNEILRTVTIEKVTKSVKVKDTFITSNKESDLGSTYVPLYCSDCHSTLGKVYKTTRPGLDKIRELFTFNVDRISSYQIGTADQSLSASNDALHNMISLADTRTISIELERMQALFLAINLRLEGVEKHIGIEPED